MHRQLVLTALGALLFAAPWLCSPAPAADRPNIVLIMVDDMGYSDLGSYGGEIHSPNLDKLAMNGIRFTNFTNCAKCETTRSALMSGRYHTEVGRGQLSNCIPMAAAMQLGGYHTMMVGKWHLNDTPMNRGFDRYFGFLNGASNFFTGEGTNGGKHFRLDREEWTVPETGFYCTDAFTDFAITFLSDREKNKAHKQKPFFLYVSHKGVHADFVPADRHRGKYDDQP